MGEVALFFKNIIIANISRQKASTVQFQAGIFRSVPWNLRIAWEA